MAWKNSGIEVDYRCKGGCGQVPWENGQRSCIPGRQTAAE